MSTKRLSRFARMHINPQTLVPAWATAVAFLGLVAISTTAESNGASSSPQPFSAVCQSDGVSVSSVYQDCGANPDGTVGPPLVPKLTKKCFFLTDVTAVNNNAIKQLDLRNADGSRGTPAKVVYFVPVGTTVQGFQTPIEFDGDLYVDIHNPNNNLYITVSGYYAKCL